MPGDHLRVAAHQPLTAHREGAVLARFRNAGALQQRQGAAASAEKHKRRLKHLRRATGRTRLHQPAAAAALQAHHLVLEPRVHPLQQRFREGAEIHIRAAGHPRGRQGLIEAAALHHQRHPFAQLGAVATPLHAGELGSGVQRFPAAPQKGHVLLAPYQAEVRNPADERSGILQHALLHQGTPKLQAQLKGAVNGQRLRDRHRSIGSLGGVVELAVGRMASACVIQRRAALRRHTRQPLEHHHLEGGIELTQQPRQGGAHDSGPHQQGVAAVRHQTGPSPHNGVTLHVRGWGFSRPWRSWPA